MRKKKTAAQHDVFPTFFSVFHHENSFSTLSSTDETEESSGFMLISHSFRDEKMSH
jgi:hypothetical protein